MENRNKLDAIVHDRACMGTIPCVANLDASDHTYKLHLAPRCATLVSTPVASCNGSPVAHYADHGTTGHPTHTHPCKRPHSSSTLRPGKRSMPTATAHLASGTAKCIKQAAVARHRGSQAPTVAALSLLHAKLWQLDSLIKAPQDPWSHGTMPMHAPPLPLYVPRGNTASTHGHAQATHGKPKHSLRCPSLQSQVDGMGEAAAPGLSPAALHSLLPLAAAQQLRCCKVCCVE